MARDPVCGMEVDEASAAGRSDFRNETFYLCSPGCKKAFDRDPEKYLGSTASKARRGGK